MPNAEKHIRRAFDKDATASNRRIRQGVIGGARAQNQQCGQNADRFSYPDD